MKESANPQYVDRNGDIVYRPPYLQAGTRLMGWVLPSTQDALQKVLDDALNTPSGGAVDYRPLFSSVITVLADIEKVSSLDPRDKQRGWVPEQDICFWILTGAYVDDGTGTGNKVLDHIAFYIPYIWVTNAYTMATGRESFGYPKSFGWAQMAKTKDDAGPIWADGMVLAKYTPETEVSRERLISVQRAPAPPTRAGEPAETGTTFSPGQGKAAIRAIVEKMKTAGGIPGIDWNLVFQLIDDVLFLHLPMVFLKQYRSALDGTSACYQAIIEANATVTEWSEVSLLPSGWNIQLNEYASAQIITDLALSANPEPQLGLWVHYSFSMDLGQEVWRGGK